MSSRRSCRIVAVSDTHQRHDALVVPEGDVLVHAGDGCIRGTLREVEALGKWLASLPHPHKVVIAGNHDWAFERTPDLAREALGDVCYLQDAGVTLGGVRFWGSPWQPEFMNWAFNLPRGPMLERVWAAIPSDTEVLVTHGPPWGHGDRCLDGRRVGCEALGRAVAKVKPRIHIFGHIHEGRGITRDAHTRYINASSCDVRYRPVHAPFVIDL